MFNVLDCWTWDARHEEWFTRAWQGDGLMGQEGKIEYTQHSHAFAPSVTWTFFRKTCQLKSHEWTDVNYLWKKCILMLPAGALQILASAQSVLRGIPSDHQTVYGVRKPMWIKTWRREDMIETGLKPCISECNKVRSDIFLFNIANQNQISDFGSLRFPGCPDNQFPRINVTAQGIATWFTTVSLAMALWRSCTIRYLGLREIQKQILDPSWTSAHKMVSIRL